MGIHDTNKDPDPNQNHQKAERSAVMMDISRDIYRDPDPILLLLRSQPISLGFTILGEIFAYVTVS